MRTNTLINASMEFILLGRMLTLREMIATFMDLWGLKKKQKACANISHKEINFWGLHIRKSRSAWGFFWRFNKVIPNQGNWVLPLSLSFISSVLLSLLPGVWGTRNFYSQAYPIESVQEQLRLAYKYSGCHWLQFIVSTEYWTVNIHLKHYWSFRLKLMEPKEPFAKQQRP